MQQLNKERLASLVSNHEFNQAMSSVDRIKALVTQRKDAWNRKMFEEEAIDDIENDKLKMEGSLAGSEVSHHFSMHAVYGKREEEPENKCKIVKVALQRLDRFVANVGFPNCASPRFRTGQN